MTVQKFLVIDPSGSGLNKEIAATVTSAGAADAGKIPALAASGFLDPTVMPAGIGSASVSVLASEALASGALVNVYANAGAANVRNANATDNTKPANGFVLSSVASAANATVYFPGQIVTGVSGLTIGAPVFLSTTSGGVTSTAPTATGNLLQFLGWAMSTTSFVFAPQPGITRA